MWKSKLQAVRSAYSRLAASDKKNYAIVAAALIAGCTLGTFTAWPEQESLCTFDAARENQRAASAAVFPDPQITAIDIDGVQSWTSGSTTPPLFKPGQTITLKGTGFGAGPDIDYTKIMIGNTRVLERDLTMYQQLLDQGKEINFETTTVADTWNKDIVSWNDTTIVFKVPGHVSSGPLIVQIQKRTGYNKSLLHPATAHLAIDAITRRITDTAFKHKCDVVSTLSDAKGTTPIAVNVSNPNFSSLVTLGRQIFWSYDYNIGVAHIIRGLDWSKILNYQTNDPIAGGIADPAVLFGAYRTNTTDMPLEASQNVYFDPYPQPTPIPGLLGGDQKTKGNTRDTGWVGYRYAQASHPYTGDGEWIGFNCASCHSYKINYETRPGVTTTKVIPGLPNPRWSMRWSILGDFEGIKTSEKGPAWTSTAAADVDKSGLIYSMPSGAGEHALIRVFADGSETANDYQFSPIAIPNVTNYMTIRRSLSHTESYAGFEGSYIHSEEPDGATGAMRAAQLKALTAYMTTLDANDNDLRNAGMYRWLKNNGKLSAQTGLGNLSEGEFVQAGWNTYSGVRSNVQQGKAIFDRDCASCHRDSVGGNTNEKMFKLNEVGRFFAPTIYHKKQQAIRATFLRDLYWVQHRGLLSDGHVRNIEDLVNPARCTEGSALYNQYYTVHAAAVPALGGPDHPQPYPAHNRKGDVFRVQKFASSASNDDGAKRNRFTERHKYFVTMPGDNNWYYWDYQKMRREYGPAELGTSAPIGMPAAPHPWCAQNTGDMDALVEYLLTL